jgi:hypothetical protein
MSNRKSIDLGFLGRMGILMIMILATGCQERDIFPETLSGCTLIKTYRDKLARETVDNLHDQPISPDINHIAYYDGNDEKITIYVATFPDEEKAHKAYDNMIVKITPFNSIFTGGKYSRVKGKEVYHLNGLVDEHYLFVKKNQVFWLAVKSDHPDQIIGEYVSYIF